jgi:hypothetical protein
VPPNAGAPGAKHPGQRRAMAKPRDSAEGARGEGTGAGRRVLLEEAGRDASGEAGSGLAGPFQFGGGASAWGRPALALREGPDRLKIGRGADQAHFRRRFSAVQDR